MTQAEAIKILQTGANVFLTGEPGSGKTHTVNAYVDWLREHDIEPSITASTGIAATHIGGFTIHSWSGIGIKKFLSDQDIDAISQNKRVVNRISSARILIIDEISMLSAQTFAMVDAVCREIRHSGEPFGGLQVVLVGDFFQLPPVSKREDEPVVYQGLFETESAQAIFAFDSPAWKALNPLVCYLTEQHRQDDTTFLDLLSAVRSGNVEESHLKLLRTRYSKTPKAGVTELYSHNEDVNRINDQELEKISGDKKIFEMESIGPEGMVISLKRGCLSPEVLSLKVGARVMFTKNDIERKFVNGTLATVVGFEQEDGYPLVETRDGRKIVARPEEWHIEDGGKVLARIIQIPLRLAWAMTVHKSQGMSLDAAHMDLSRTFEYGQGYVAISRVRALSGLTLGGLNKRALQIHPDIILKDETFREYSELTGESFSKLTSKELEKMHQNFVRAFGGKPVSSVKKLKTSDRVSTYDKTKAFLENKLSVAQIAKERKLSQGVILGHIEKLYSEKKVSPAELTYLVLGNEDKVAKVHLAIEKVGFDRLKPIFEHLEGRISYEIIRLARLLFPGQK